MLLTFPCYLQVTTVYLVVTSGYLVFTSSYLIATTGYFWLLLIPRFSSNGGFTVKPNLIQPLFGHAFTYFQQTMCDGGVWWVIVTNFNLNHWRNFKQHLNFIFKIKIKTVNISH